jgi:hypothetical protein
VLIGGLVCIRDLDIKDRCLALGPKAMNGKVAAKFWGGSVQVLSAKCTSQLGWISGLSVIVAGWCEGLSAELTPSGDHVIMVV